MTESFLARWSRLKRTPACPRPPNPTAASPPEVSQRAEEARAALRVSWITDPAIRDFVGVAENQWDFNDPEAMPGFGPLFAGEITEQAIGRLLAMLSRPALALNLPTLMEPSRPEPAQAEHLDAVWCSSGLARKRLATSPASAAPRRRLDKPGLAMMSAPSHGGALPVAV